MGWYTYEESFMCYTGMKSLHFVCEILSLVKLIKLIRYSVSDYRIKYIYLPMYILCYLPFRSISIYLYNGKYVRFLLLGHAHQLYLFAIVLCTLTDDIVFYYGRFGIKLYYMYVYNSVAYLLKFENV